MKHIILTLIATLSLYTFSSMAKDNNKLAVNHHALKANHKTQMLVTFMENLFSNSTSKTSENLTLSTASIWKNNADAAGKWIYTEQASSVSLTHPFRQNIYNVVQINDSTFLTAVYNLPNASQYTGAYQNLNLLASLKPSDLDFKKDCQVFVVFYKNNQMQLGNGAVLPTNVIAPLATSCADDTNLNNAATTSADVDEPEFVQ
jgi:hypothetical protein